MTPQHQAAIRTFKKNIALQEAGRLESLSGCGSCLKSAATAIRIIPEIIRDHDVKTIADCPCGDLNWLGTIDMKGVDYRGYDVVEQLIGLNKQKHPEKRFFVFDAMADVIPPADLIICRDFLFHLSFGEGNRVIDNFRKSGSKLLLTTSFNDLERNSEIPAGRVYGYRDINVCIDPYNLGPPIIAEREFGNRFLNLYFL